MEQNQILLSSNGRSPSDPVLLAACLAVILLIALIPLSLPITVHGAFLGITIIMAVGARIPLTHLASRMILVLPAILGALLILPLLDRPSHSQILGIPYSIEGWHRGTATALKLLSIAIWLGLVTNKLPPHRLFPALTTLRAPEWLIEILGSTYRNLGLLTGEAGSMRRALKSRVIRRGWWLLPAAGNMVGLLFLRTREKAASQLVARESRCHGNEPTTRVNVPSIQISNLSYCYPGGESNALHGIWLEIPAGEKVAVLGCNGAGKTTLLLQLNAVLPLQSGRISVGGINIDRTNRASIRKEVGMVFQNPDDQILAMTVGEDVAIGPNQLDLEEEEKADRVETALRQVGLWRQREQPPHQLSTGQRKRLALAGVLASGSRLVLLDEPMASLDPPGRDQLVVLLNDLSQAGHTIVTATHDLEFASEWSTMVVLMDGGHLVASGPAEEILSRGDLMSSVGFATRRRLP